MLYKKYIIIIALIIIILILVINTRRREMFKINFTLSGGFPGFFKRIEIDGRILIYRIRNSSYKFELKDENIMFLKSFIEDRLKYIRGEYQPVKGADFLKYRLSIELNGRNYTVSWVDEWALNKSLPKEILEIENLFKKLLEIYEVKSSYNRVAYIEKNNLVLEIYVRKLGEKIFLAALIENLGEDIKYISPTPCHPNILIKIDEERIFYPGYTDTPCIQVLEERVLRRGEQKITLAIWTPQKTGIYEIEASFPFHGEKLIKIKQKIKSD